MKIKSNLSFNQLQSGIAKSKKVEKNFKDILTNKSKNNDNLKEDQLKKVSEEFESIFVGMMLKEMRDSGFKSNLLDSGLSKDIFEDMYYDKIAKEAAKKGDLGIAEAVYRQLNYKR